MATVAGVLTLLMVAVAVPAEAAPAWAAPAPATSSAHAVLPRVVAELRIDRLIEGFRMSVHPNAIGTAADGSFAITGAGGTVRFDAAFGVRELRRDPAADGGGATGAAGGYGAPALAVTPAGTVYRRSPDGALIERYDPPGFGAPLPSTRRTAAISAQGWIAALWSGELVLADVARGEMWIDDGVTARPVVGTGAVGAAGPMGTLWTVDAAARELRVRFSDGVPAFSVVLEPLPGLGRPRAAAVGSDWVLLLLGEGALAAYSEAGRLLWHIGHLDDSTNTPIRRVDAIAYDAPRGRVFASDPSTNRLIVMDQSESVAETTGAAWYAFEVVSRVLDEDPLNEDARASAAALEERVSAELSRAAMVVEAVVDPSGHAASISALRVVSVTTERVYPSAIGNAAPFTIGSVRLHNGGRVAVEGVAAALSAGAWLSMPERGLHETPGTAALWVVPRVTVPPGAEVELPIWTAAGLPLLLDLQEWFRTRGQITVSTRTAHETHELQVSTPLEFAPRGLVPIRQEQWLANLVRNASDFWQQTDAPIHRWWPAEAVRTERWLTLYAGLWSELRALNEKAEQVSRRDHVLVHPPAYTTRRGGGSARERAVWFAERAGRLGIETLVLRAQPPVDASTPANAAAIAVALPIPDEMRNAWLYHGPGVAPLAIEGHLYLPLDLSAAGRGFMEAWRSASVQNWRVVARMPSSWQRNPEPPPLAAVVRDVTAIRAALLHEHNERIERDATGMVGVQRVASVNELGVVHAVWGSVERARVLFQEARERLPRRASSYQNAARAELLHDNAPAARSLLEAGVRAGALSADWPEGRLRLDVVWTRD